MAIARRVESPIAVRRYGVEGEPGREIVLVIGKPRKDPRLTSTWTCAVRIEGIPKQKHRRGQGVDAVQAPDDAMVCARRELDASGLRLTWLDGEPGALGLPLSVPTGWGLDFHAGLSGTFCASRASSRVRSRQRERRRSGRPGRSHPKACCASRFAKSAVFPV